MPRKDIYMITKLRRNVNTEALLTGLMQSYANVGVNVIGFSPKPTHEDIAEKRYHRLMAVVIVAEVLTLFYWW